MIAYALTFVCGAWVLQHMASLPALYWALLVPLLAWLAWRTRHWVRLLTIAACGLLCGLLWATLLAQMRLYQALPAQWQGVDIRLQGVVASLPQTLEHGQRFLLQVEQVLTPPEQLPPTIEPPPAFPQLLSLSAYAGRGAPTARVAEAQPADISVGQDLPAKADDRQTSHVPAGAVRANTPHASASPSSSAPASAIAVDSSIVDMTPTSETQASSSQSHARHARAHQAAPRFHAGQRWQLVVRLKQPHGTANPHTFDFEAWALQQDIRATGTVRSQRLLQAAVWRPAYMLEMLRERIAERMQRVLGNRPYAGVLRALAIGDESGIGQAQWQVFILSGTNHLMSISGLHITMLAGLAYTLAYALWRRRPRLVLWLPARKAGLLVGAVAALGYALVAGFSIPTQRTLYMLLVLAWALWSGRQLALTRVLAYALLLVVLVDPWAVLAPGFWLSFGAIAVIALAGSGRLRPYGWLRGAVVTQWAVSIGLLPLLLCLFQQVSLVSPLANAVAIPLVSLVVVPLTLLGSLPGMDWALLLAHTVMTLTMQLLDLLLQWPLVRWQQAAPPFWSVALALLGVLWLLLPRGFPLRWLGLVALLPMLCWRPVSPLPGEMRVTLLDVGQGLAVLVQTARHALLYDAGPRYSAQSDSGSRIVVPYLRGEGVARLHGMVISHDDDDHSGGMASVLAQLPVDWLLSSMPATRLRQQLDAAAALPWQRNRAQGQAWKAHGYCLAGQAWEWDQVRFQMLGPAADSYAQAGLKDNDRSCVLRVSSRDGSLLLTGDIERRAEAGLLARGVTASDVVVVPHHGSRTSSSPALVEALQARIAIFTVGYRNCFGHPKAQVLQRYAASGSRLYRSDRDGALLLEFNAQGIMLHSWRERYRRYWQPAWTQEQIPAK